jgi:hypothetical protein
LARFTRFGCSERELEWSRRVKQSATPFVAMIEGGKVDEEPLGRTESGKRDLDQLFKPNS